MILPKSDDAIHRAWMYRILTAISDIPLLNSALGFKGGTCAALRGLIDRFSVDLDFDLLDEQNLPMVHEKFERIFKKLGLKVKDQSKNAPQYFLKYPGAEGQRNTIKVDCSFPVPRNNLYEMVRIVEIDRIFNCQSISTMFANKLVAITDRYEQTGALAGRDLFDIHSFFLKGLEVNEKVIEERTGKNVPEYFKFLIEFIDKNVTQTVIDEDLNTLLPRGEFQAIRKILKQEVLTFCRSVL